jgi:selenoprotein W-related protein
LKSDIEKNFPGAKVKLIPSGRGVFEVVKNGELIFSKKSLGRFPEHQEIFTGLR